jgi:outer membrane protein TolC
MNDTVFFRLRWVIVWIGLWCAADRAAGQEAVTLAQCYEWARMNYPLIQRYDLIDRAEQYNLSNAGKGWLPQPAVNAKASYQSDVTRLPFDTEKISAVIPGFTVPVLGKDQYQMVAELNQTIWDGGRVSSTRRVIRAQADAARRQLDSDLYALNGRVNQLYFGCLLQDELLRRNGLLQKELQVNIDRIKALMENGLANQPDCESMEVEWLNARQNETGLKASRKAFGQMLAALTGHSLDGVELEIPRLPGMPLSMVVNRPELRELDAQSALAETQDKQLNAGLKPRISAFIQGGYGRPGLNMLEDGFNPFYIAGVRLSWNIGPLYTLKNDRRKTGVTLREIDIRRETFLFNIRLQLLQQDTEIQKMNELIQSDEEIIRLRSGIKQAAEVKLENGVISVADLIREINAEDMARQAAATHRIQRLAAIYERINSLNHD